MKYQAPAASIKSFEERKDSKGKDTFDLSDWQVSEWRKVRLHFEAYANGCQVLS